MLLVTLSLLWISEFTPAPASQSAWSGWTSTAQIRLPSGAEEQFVRVTLTPRILAEANTDLAELRVVDDIGAERPFVLTSLSERLELSFHECGVLDPGVVPGDYQQVVCDRGEEARISNEIRLETPAQDFHRQVRVWGSPDGADWLLLRDKAFVFRHQSPTASNLQVSFPDTSYRFIKLEIRMQDSEPIPVSALQVARVRRREAPIESQGARIVDRARNADRQASDLRLELPLLNQHFERVRLEVSDATFRRWAEISYQDEQRRWIEVGASYIYRLPGEEAREEQLLIPTDDFNQRHARLRIWNEDNPPLEVTRVVFERNPKILVFRPEPDRRYRLMIQNPAAAVPDYDLDPAVARLDVLELPQAKLGEPTSNPDYRPPSVEPPWTERHPALIWAGLALGAILLLWLLRSTLRGSIIS